MWIKPPLFLDLIFAVSHVVLECVFCLFPPIPTDPCSPTAVHQCSEAQKLLNITRELLHTEEAYVKRLNLLDQVTSSLLLVAMHLGGGF